ncbi:MAG: hypothetical protein KBD06_04485 [Candidatus Pacebacteria bacterium]|nr:hypothetical protein [Candidatus Paceibacterota bacterium]
MLTKGRFFAAANYTFYYLLSRFLLYLSVLCGICAIGTVVLASLVAYEHGIVVMLSYRLELAIGVVSVLLTISTHYLRRWTIRHYRSVVWPRQTYN